MPRFRRSLVSADAVCAKQAPTKAGTWCLSQACAGFVNKTLRLFVGGGGEQRSKAPGRQGAGFLQGQLGAHRWRAEGSAAGELSKQELMTKWPCLPASPGDTGWECPLWQVPWEA